MLLILFLCLIAHFILFFSECVIVNQHVKNFCWSKFKIYSIDYIRIYVRVIEWFMDNYLLLT